jgi:hypothetical protein
MQFSGNFLIFLNLLTNLDITNYIFYFFPNMKFKLYREFGALNSPEIFSALEKGLKFCGHEIVSQNEDIPVIWSVLWKGRMLANKKIYHQARAEGKKVLIIEVGNLIRGKTWRISLDNINNRGFFGNTSDVDQDRPQILGVCLRDLQKNRKSEVLICSQLPESLQWEGMPNMETWITDTIQEIKSVSDRKIVLRPHPRAFFKNNLKDVRIELPRKIPNTYDDFDIDYNFHCVINHNSGPCVQSAIFGTPVICDQSSLAWPVSDHYKNIENISLSDRENWFVELCHTEWTVEEISKGIPIQRIFKKSLDF